MATVHNETASTTNPEPQSPSHTSGSQTGHNNETYGNDESEEEGEIASSGEEEHSASIEQHPLYSGKLPSPPVESAGHLDQSLQRNRRKRAHPDSESNRADFGNGDLISAHSTMDHGRSELSLARDNEKDSKKRPKFGPGPRIVDQDWDGDLERRSRSPLPLNRSKLPDELWQSILTYVPPPSLARVMGVNRKFAKYLASSQNPGAEKTGSRPIDPKENLEAEAIWTASRKLFCPGMPKPLEGRSELEMWQLLCNKRCTFCGKVDLSSDVQPASPPWEPELEKNGVTVIWPFRVRSCGPCLLKQSEKEIEILISSSVPSALLVALPFVFLSPLTHVVTPFALQNSTHPPQFQMTKHFLKTDIGDLKDQFDEVKLLGPAAAEGWFKGLAEMGKERLQESARWERWVSSGGLTNALARCQNFRPALHTDQASTTSHTQNAVAPYTSSDRRRSPNIPFAGGMEAAVGSPAPANLPTNAQASSSRPASVSVPQGYFHPPQGSSQQPRVERNLREVNELKAARRAEIERRCLELSPPLHPPVLNHMDSFQAAVQIPTPFTDSAWEVLKPRLLAQREVAEQKENDRIGQNRTSQAKIEERRQQEAHLKETKEMQDKAWEEVQAPIRERLGRYAQQIIKDIWKGGEIITNETSPKFAADVLLYVRRRFYGDIAEDDSVVGNAGEHPKRDRPDGPPSRKLILENMKWVFDTQIKPLTEQYRKELFLCHDCENNFKFYGFEGVIQHFAAKHTSALSVGSVVVHWRAEWPAYPPFHPDPSVAKAAFYAVPPPGSLTGQPTAPSPHPPFAYGAGYGGYSQSTGPVAQGAPNGIQGYHAFSPGPYGHSQYPEQYPGHHNGPYPPPQPFHGPPAAFQGHQQGFPQGNLGSYQSSQPGYPGPAPGYQHFIPPYQGQQQNQYGSPHPSQVNPASMQSQMHGVAQPFGQHPHAYAPPVGNGLPPNNVYPCAPPTAPQPATQAPTGPSGQTGGIYQVQLEDMAKFAREAWSSTSGIKDLSSSVRTYVLIHYVTSKFKSKFANEPALHMFIDGLASQALMKPIKSFNGLACKACLHSGNAPGSAFHSHPPSFPAADRKLYTLPNLLNHFQTVHIERSRPANHTNNGHVVPKADWKSDMVELPEQPVITELLHAPGMDDRKLHLIAQAFPDAFPRPLPRIGPAKNTGPVPVMHDSHEPSERAVPARQRPIGRGRDSPHQYPRNDLNGAHSQVRNLHGGSELHHPTPQYGPAMESFPSDQVPVQLRDSRPGSESPSHRYPYPHARSNTRIAPNLKPRNQGDAYLQSSRSGGSDWGNGVQQRDRQHRVGLAETNETVRQHESNHVHESSRADPRSSRERVNHITSEGSNTGAASRENRRYSHLAPDKTEERAHVLVTGGPLLPRVPRGRQEAGSEIKDEGSEDGEVGGGLSTVVERDRVGTLAEEPSEAAERFLDSFLPGEDTEAYKRRAAEHDRRKEEQIKGRWLLENERDQQSRGVEGRGRRLADEWSDLRSRKSDLDDSRTIQDRAHASPTHFEPKRLRAAGPTSPVSRDMVLQPHQYNHEDQLLRSPPRSVRRTDPIPENDPRYAHNRVTYHDDRQITDGLRRPRSRYDRYESFRQPQSRIRSRSPRRFPHHVGDIQGRDASPAIGALRPTQGYRMRSPVLAMADRLPTDDVQAYPQISPQAPYPQNTYVTYANDPREIGPFYQESMDYMPVRMSAQSPPPRGAYPHRPTNEMVSGYTRYEDEPQRRPLYDHHGQLYRVERAVYEDEDPRGYQSQQLRY
ncbi:MAG: hypothetical protein M1837_003938 [Sclerophora amabilis]|nr:MAG: hypothetical protein M1837_003938 [Sclerophora amabilis]